MRPNGIVMTRPPANCLPPGSVWQATQSPARARYSPLLIVCVVGSAATAPGATGRYPGMKYRSAASAISATNAAATRKIRVARRIADLHLATASLRHLLEIGRGRGRVGRRVLRGEPRRHRVDVRFGQSFGDALHAIGWRRLPVSAPPPRELRGDVGRR